jgi:hypothetical protein
VFVNLPNKARHEARIAARREARASLGTLTKSAPKSTETARCARRKRYNLQKTASDLLPGHRVCSCGWRPIKGGQLGISRRGDKHFISNARVCGSVWACPVCAAKIASTRSEELRAAVDAWTAQGGAVWLLTLTIDHTAKDELENLLKRFTQAMSKLWANRWSENWRTEHGQVGIVRNLEVTWGLSNGWHPHCHALLFVSADADPFAAEQDIKHRWQHVAARFGFSVSLQRGARIDAPDDDLADYLAKYASKADTGSSWGFAEELTWSNIKVARGARFTPFTLLAACDSSDVGAAPLLFQEYVDAFHGRRQLYWSKGLRDLLGLNKELSDEDVAHAHDDQSVFVAAIDTPIFCYIKARGLLCDLLDVADELGLDGIKAFLEWAYDCRFYESRITSPTPVRHGPSI